MRTAGCIIVTLTVLAILFLSPSLVISADAAYAGSNVCKTCHTGSYGTWAKTTKDTQGKDVTTRDSSENQSVYNRAGYNFDFVSNKHEFWGSQLQIRETIAHGIDSKTADIKAPRLPPGAASAFAQDNKAAPFTKHQPSLGFSYSLL